jgi:hypothetical protein
VHREAVWVKTREMKAYVAQSNPSKGPAPCHAIDVLLAVSRLAGGRHWPKSQPNNLGVAVSGGDLDASLASLADAAQVDCPGVLRRREKGASLPDRIGLW